MHLVPDWRQAWRWLSLQIAAAGMALQAAIIAFPDIKDWVGDKVAHYVGLLILLAVVVARLTVQQPPRCEE